MSITAERIHDIVLAFSLAVLAVAGVVCGFARFGNLLLPAEASVGFAAAAIGAAAFFLIDCLNKNLNRNAAAFFCLFAAFSLLAGSCVGTPAIADKMITVAVMLMVIAAGVGAFRK